MKIPNYDPGFFKSSYMQGHPCMPTDVFRMLICGPSNSGKTNILLHMLYELLEFDKKSNADSTVGKLYIYQYFKRHSLSSSGSYR